MSMYKGNNSVPDSVKERRLRPLYELLDAGNYKKVVQEADKITKKHPTLSCAKVFKAIAYIRMGKIEDGRRTIKETHDEAPTDDGTLHAMSIFYREIDEPEKVCELYENASKKEPSEDLITCYFMSNVRMMNYLQQYKIALQLYRQFSKGAYHGWTVMSLYIRGVIAEKPHVAKNTIKFASEMMKKYISECPHCNEQDYQLYLMILCRQKDYETALAVLQESHKKGVIWSRGVCEGFELNCRLNLDIKDGLKEFLEKCISNETKDYKYYLQYLESFGHTDSEVVIQLFTKLAYNSANVVASRAAIIALILHTHTTKKGKEAKADIRKYILDHFKKFGCKPFFLRDMHKFFSYLKNDKDLMDQFVAESALANAQTKNLEIIIQRKANLATLQYYVDYDDIKTDQLKTMEYITSFVTDYFDSKAIYELTRVNVDPREASPFEDYLIGASVALLNTFWNSFDFWKGYFLDCELRTLKLAGSHSSSKTPTQNGEVVGDIDHFSWNEHDFPVLLNLALLEYGLEISPYCSPLRLLLGKSYTYCGAVSAGLDHFMKLDIKHMQVDSVGYLYLPKVYTSGLFIEAHRVMSQADAFYSNHSKEQMEHVISAYKFCSWPEVVEFMDFREIVLKSFQASEARVETRLLDFLIDGNSRGHNAAIAQRDGFDYKVAFDTTFKDNRDFGIYHFVYEPVPKSLKELTFKDSVQRLKIRSTILSAIVSFINAASNSIHEGEVLQNAANGILAVSKLREEMLSTFESFRLDHSQRSLVGPWPPCVHEYANSGCVDILMGHLDLIGTAATGLDNPESVTEKLCGAMKDVEEHLTQIVTTIAKSWDRVGFVLKNLSNLSEELYILFETLALVCIIMDTYRYFIEQMIGPTMLSASTKNKRKKGKDPVNSALIDGYNALVNALLESLKIMEKAMATLTYASGSYYSYDWPSVEKKLKEKVPAKILNNVLQHSLEKVFERLNSSYSKAHSEMKYNITKKLAYAESLIIKI